MKECICNFIHTLLETGFMAAIGLVIARIRFSRRMLMNQKELLEQMVTDRTAEIRLTRKTAIEALANILCHHYS